MKARYPILAALGVFAALGSASAQPASSSAVFVGGTPVMRVRVAAGGMTPEQRADQIQQRVNLALGHGPIAASDITVEPSGNEAVVNVKGQLLLTADWATARYNQSTPMELAQTWADNMRGILPSLTQAK
ncbi:hypothetical protein CCAX7_007370 [Capsulimonas corticalis]|uniref:Uncharacterized protein n=1 Tax=Capsulimonas corticalis TaxID=2219043 RepID=A0A402D1T0_9BACT|nr:hypothetical protein [Capsulimonas corticalis]BDI28686.1 hypothetical protein CCAX7_007370 [Capsulimonas corticalis]